jgi:uncharacterized repeat protein (TIGR01451 family)
MKFCKYLAAGVLALASSAAFALGTPAGTNIQNTAEVTYSIGSTPITASSNTSSVTVAEIIDVNVTTLSPSVLVTPASTQQEIALRVTNTGNGSETFSLTRNSNVTGDDFDPTASATSIYFDTDASGDLSPSDIAYSPGVNNPTLAPDASVVVLLVHDIPGAVTDGQRGRAELVAAALTGTGAAGAVFPGAGSGGVDAVAGTSGGDGAAQGDYLVAAVQLNAVKSQTIADQFGGTRPVPGARINYRIQVATIGAGTATAVTLSDTIPANTTYVAGTLRLNSVALSDAADADAGQFQSAPTSQVRVALGNLTTASGTQVLEFAVTIN